MYVRTMRCDSASVLMTVNPVSDTAALFCTGGNCESLNDTVELFGPRENRASCMSTRESAALELAVLGNFKPISVRGTEPLPTKYAATFVFNSVSSHGRDIMETRKSLNFPAGTNASNQILAEASQ